MVGLKAAGHRKTLRETAGQPQNGRMTLVVSDQIT